MDPVRETRWDRKHRLIIEAAAATFLTHGYLGTSMDDIAATAAVSKQTVYKHFADKQQLFAGVVLATTDLVAAGEPRAGALADRFRQMYDHLTS